MTRIVLDTSVLTRFFTNDIPLKARRVKKLLNSNKNLFVPDVVFPELEYVLSGTAYNASREKISTAFHFLISRKNITVSPEVARAVEIYESTKLDIADCIIAAYSLNHTLLSYDKKLLAVEGVRKA